LTLSIWLAERWTRPEGGARVFGTTIERHGIALRTAALRFAGANLFSGDRATHIAVAVTVGALFGVMASNLAYLSEVLNQWGEDYQFFADVGRRWLETGAFYNAHQLAGPYEARTAVDVLYPPVALYLFVPFAVLPAFLWWVIPLGILVWHVVSSRPAWWAWPVIALIILAPRSQSIIIWGNTGMWMTAFIALGLRYAWASPLVLLKPTFVPFALIGVRNRAWWLGMAVFIVASLAMLPLWFDYVSAMRNNSGNWPPGFVYSLPDYLLAMLPIVAWWSGAERPARFPRIGPRGAPSSSRGSAFGDSEHGLG
jgi:hypothetical protein